MAAPSSEDRPSTITSPLAFTLRGVYSTAGKRMPGSDSMSSCLITASPRLAIDCTCSTRSKSVAHSPSTLRNRLRMFRLP